MKWTFERANERQATVNGEAFKVYDNYATRGTIAEREDGTTKQLSGSGYISNDLTVRKAIAVQFHLPTFRK